MFDQILAYLVGVSAGVGGLSCKWNAVYRVLRCLFDEWLCHSVLPIWETGHVRTHCSERFLLLHHSSVSLLRWQTLASFKCIACGRVQVHSVRVDDFAFLFKVERLLVIFVWRLRRLIRVVLLVVGKQFRIRVPDKAVSATGIASGTFITDRQSRV